MIRRAGIGLMLVFILMWFMIGTLLGLVGGDCVVRLYLNAKAGCYPWSAAEVEYHDGMTLCPGQSFRLMIPLIIDRPKIRDNGI